MNSNVDIVLVFANGLIEDTAWLRPYVARAAAVIAADGGIRYPLALGRRPDILIGDLDSLPEGVVDELPEWETEVIRYPAAKDETDLELALSLARRRFPDAEILIGGGFGGRLDQTLANILLLAHPELIGHPIRFIERDETAWLITGQAEIRGRPGDTVSLIPLDGAARVAATTGLRWPLRDETLAFGPARGVSNEMTSDRATVRLASGMLLCVHRRVFIRSVD
jgi:thiamine pyrophosphokinase